MVTVVAKKTPGTFNQRISTQTVPSRSREIGERPPYTMYVLYAAFLFWPSILLAMGELSAQVRLKCDLYVYRVKKHPVNMGESSKFLKS